MVHTGEFYIVLQEVEAKKIIEKIIIEGGFIANFGSIVVKKILIGDKISWRGYIYMWIL